MIGRIVLTYLPNWYALAYQPMSANELNSSVILGIAFRQQMLSYTAVNECERKVELHTVLMTIVSIRTRNSARAMLMAIVTSLNPET